LQDFGELTQALLAECEPYGQIHSLQLTHNKRAGRVACVVELDSPRHVPALKRALGITTGLGGSVYLEIPVHADFARADAAPELDPGVQHGLLLVGRASPLTA
jgi:hypothetical protein